MGSDACPKCGGAMELTEKDTSSGSDMRTTTCLKCGRGEIVNGGVALWQALSDAREAEAAPERPVGFFGRIKSWFRRKT